MDHSMNSPDPDIIRIQERISYLEQTVTELSSVLYEQHKQMDRISRMTDLLTEKVRSLKDGAPDSIPSEKPPHY